MPLWFASRNLPPGRYRVTLLGTGPLSVSIPISGRSDQHVRVDGKAHAFARLIRPSSLPSTDAGEPVNNFGAPVPPGHYELGSLTRFAHGNYTQADVGDECFTTSQSCAAEGSVASDGFFIVGNSGEGAIASGWTTSPMDLGPGVNATFDDVDAGLNAGQAGLVVLVAAPKHRVQRSAGQGGSSGPRIVALNGG